MKSKLSTSHEIIRKIHFSESGNITNIAILPDESRIFTFENGNTFRSSYLEALEVLKYLRNRRSILLAQVNILESKKTKIESNIEALKTEISYKRDEEETEDWM